MRVISGMRKGHRLCSPKGMDVRPTEDKVKESLFNILGKIKTDSLVLDLFAGSGSIGIEFLSRGAGKCYFIDVSPRSISAIKENLSHTRLAESATVIKTNALSAIRDFSKSGIEFDYIYVDPPFGYGDLLDKVFKNLNDHPILKDEGLLIVEHESQRILDEEIFEFKRTDSRRYGSKTITFFKRFRR